MGFGTYLTTDLYYNRKSYTSLGEVEADLDEARRMIDMLKSRIRNFAFMTEPAKFMDKEQTDPMWFIEHEVKETMEELEDYIIEEFKLSILVDRWKHCHTRDGKPILPPKDFDHYDTSYIDGDFIGFNEDEND